MKPGPKFGLKRTIALYALGLALAAMALAWLEYKYVTRVFTGEIYVVLIALGFTSLGVWAGRRLTRKTQAAPFELNHAALASLGVTDREHEMLLALADGLTNKEIARRFDVSPNTVKTHVSSLYEKLEVQRRTQAVQKAKDLALIP
ncbi:response regulator transcription factor [Hyphococcus sp.]|uniref:response regulator transcription factor n=1 Tax=Hyphococcus sp. TaxID=2038636 RepID=UPI002085C661|nr:MAG: helix-turn-helix transcriptional regulator [Marinicaulis sp.]